MERVLESPYFQLDLDHDRDVVRLRRMVTPFPSIAAMRLAYGAIVDALSSLERSSWALLVDARDGRARDDDEFEAAFRPIRVRLMADFRKVAILVETSAGALRVNRHSLEDKASFRPFRNEEEAWAYLKPDSGP